MQAPIFEKTLNSTISSLNSPTELLPLLDDLGKKCTNYGVQEEHVATAGASLIFTLKSIDDQWNPQVEAAWMEACSVMQNAKSLGGAIKKQTSTKSTNRSRDQKGAPHSPSPQEDKTSRQNGDSMPASMEQTNFAQNNSGKGPGDARRG